MKIITITITWIKKLELFLGDSVGIIGISVGSIAVWLLTVKSPVTTSEYSYFLENG